MSKRVQRGLRERRELSCDGVVAHVTQRLLAKRAMLGAAKTGATPTPADGRVWNDIARLERENETLRVLIARLSSDALAFH